jgi:hypothetical protein
MPERNFFNFRYGLPGYTFILIIILVAYPRSCELFISLNEMSALVPAFLAFFTLLGGSAIGFLVSQLWYFLHNLVFNRRSLSDSREFLRTKFNLVENTHQEIVFLDYVFHQSEDKIVDYVARRFDLQNTLGSTFLATVLGVTFGIFIKIDFFSTNETLSNSIDLLQSKGITCSFPNFTMYDVGIMLIIVGLLISLSMGFRFIRREHSMMVNISLKKVVLLDQKITKAQARLIFSEKYFQDKKNQRLYKKIFHKIFG